MIVDDVIIVVNKLIDWVNSIVCNIKEILEGKKIRFCFDFKDFNKNIR